MAQPHRSSQLENAARQRLKLGIEINGITLPGVSALRLLLVAYGATIRDLWTLHATRRAAIRSATTREEPDAVPLGN